MRKLEGRVALVTGASRGIGQAIAELFAAEGADVVCAARTINEGDHMLEGSLSNTVQRIIGAGGSATAVAANISEEQDCRALFDAAIDTYGKVDILVNNAALNYYVPIVNYDVGKWMRAFAVNVHGPFMLSRFVLRGMNDPKGEPLEIMAKTALLLVSEPAEKVNGRVTYSQQILKEFGWIDKGKGIGFDRTGSGYSQI